MPTNDWMIYVVAGVTALVVWVPLIIHLRAEAKGENPKIKQGWSEALRALCEELGLKYEEVPTARDRARGKIGKVDVTIKYDVPDSKMVLVVETFGSNVPEALRIRRPRATLPREAKMGKLQPIGVADFDAEMEMSGAPDAVVDALRREASLRALVRDAVVGVGASLAERHLYVEKAEFPSDVETLRAIVVPMVELGAWLSDPSAPRTGSALGTKAASRLRALDDLRGEPRMERLVEFFDPLGASLGGGKCYPRASEDKFEWQGVHRGKPLRIAVAWSGTVEIWMKQKNRFGELWYTYDPDVKESERPPAWDENSDDGVFVGPSTVAEGFGASDEVVKKRLARLPGALAARIARQLPEDRVRYFRMESDEVFVMFWPDIDEMIDPTGQITRAVELAYQCAEVAAAYVPDPNDSDDDDADDDDADDDDADDDADDET